MNPAKFALNTFAAKALPEIICSFIITAVYNELYCLVYTKLHHIFCFLLLKY